MTRFDAYPVEKFRVHGYDRAFVKVGRGPAVLLLHGIGMDHTSWLGTIPKLAEDFTVIAPDLLGHGESDKPRADYSIGGYANGMRDLLALLGVGRATIVGHSLGGGIAMQFAYQYPQMAERMVLVCSGGLGRSVSPAIRALTIPGSGPVVAAASTETVRKPAVRALRALHATGLPGTQDLQGFADVYNSMGDPKARAAFRHVLRAAVDWRGQVITMIDRAYLAENMPALVMWGRKDLAIPVRHAYAAKELLPGARLRIFEDSGHVPQVDEPQAFAEELRNFIMDTPASIWDPRIFREAMVAGAPQRRRPPTIKLPNQGESEIQASDADQKNWN
ncbi:alpha/beta fold hydrolase [Candidatus Nanopelagicales bacterium]|nr:alpha/beta fold hydrolase [Candidatus Nanopelagicales bacterium]